MPSTQKKAWLCDSKGTSEYAFVAFMIQVRVAAKNGFHRWNSFVSNEKRCHNIELLASHMVA